MENSTIVRVSALIAVIGVLSFTAYFTYLHLVPNEGPSAVGDMVVLPGNNFDAEVEVPDAGVFVMYPSRGFYAHEVRTTTSRVTSESGLVSSAHIEPVDSGSEDVQENPAEYPTVDAELFRGVTREEVVASWFGEDWKGKATAMTIDGREYTLFSSAEDVTVRGALTDLGHGLLWVSLAYKMGDTPESERAYRKNPALFLEILKHLRFE